MKPSDNKARRRQGRSPSAECLETRQVLSGGAGNTIAIMPAQILQADQAVTVEFTIAPENFKLPRGSALLGIDAVAPGDSSARPVVTAIRDHSGASVSHNSYAQPRPLVIGGQPVTPAVVAKIALQQTRRRGAGAPQPRAYKVTIKGESQTVGQFLTGFYLVGDADGNGKVERKDLNQIRKALGSKANQADYVFDADANRDGRVTPIDLRLAQQNLGVRTTIMPLISADIDPATADVNTRTSSQPQVTMQGVASSGATLAYAAVGAATAPVSTTVDATGNYKITVPLVEGSNTFLVTSTDSFGQTISGTIAAITYKPLDGS